MKNEDMKVSELLKEKNSLENKVGDIEKALKAVNNEFANGYNYKDRGSVKISCCSQSLNLVLDRDVLKEAMKSQLKRLNEELSPVADKLAAIELMLNS